jgi:hypothetical protein
MAERKGIYNLSALMVRYEVKLIQQLFYFNIFIHFVLVIVNRKGLTAYTQHLRLGRKGYYISKVLNAVLTFVAMGTN